MSRLDDLDPGGDAAYDDYSGRSARDYLGLIVASAAIIGGCVLVAILAWTAADYFLGDNAGAVTRPDYAGLGVNAPDVTTIELHPDGTAHIEFTIPDGAALQSWHVATFHVPNPDQWFDGQTLTDGGPTGPLGPGTHTYTLTTAPGACQVDLWLEGEEESYGSDTSLLHGWDTCAPPPADITPDSFPVSTPGPDATVPDAQASPPALAVASSEEIQPTLPPAVGSPPASTLALSTRAELPATGPWHHVGLLVALAAALMLAGISCCGLTQRKTRRSARVLANLRRP